MLLAASSAEVLGPRTSCLAYRRPVMLRPDCSALPGWRERVLSPRLKLPVPGRVSTDLPSGRLHHLDLPNCASGKLLGARWEPDEQLHCLDVMGDSSVDHRSQLDGQVQGGRDFLATLQT